jgi:hypothetical protein
MLQTLRRRMGSDRRSILWTGNFFQAIYFVNRIFFLLSSKNKHKHKKDRLYGTPFSTVASKVPKWSCKCGNTSAYCDAISQSRLAYHLNLMGSSLFLPFTQWSSLVVFTTLPRNNRSRLLGERCAYSVVRRLVFVCGRMLRNAHEVRK